MHYTDLGRVNYLGQPMLQRVSYCLGYARPVIGSKSKPK